MDMNEDGIERLIQAIKDQQMSQSQLAHVLEQYPKAISALVLDVTYMIDEEKERDCYTESQKEQLELLQDRIIKKYDLEE